MVKEQRAEYSQLRVGYKFHPMSYKLDSLKISVYLKAVEDANSLYHGSALVPPMAIATYAMTALSEGVAIPPGAIHISQELEFRDTVTVGDTIVCQATVSRKQDRGRLHLLTIDLGVFSQNQKQVLAGKTSFVLPEQDRGNDQ